MLDEKDRLMEFAVVSIIVGLILMTIATVVLIFFFFGGKEIKAYSLPGGGSKAEPTGCPYGDSIPLGPECDRLAPAKPTKLETPVPVYVGEVEGK